MWETVEDALKIYDLKYTFNEESRKEIKQYISDYHRDRPLEILEVDNGIILPRVPATKQYPYTWQGLGGVLDADEKFIELSGIKHISKDALAFGGKYNFDRSNVETFDESVIYIGPMFNHWGHFLYEYVTRLWYCYRNDIKAKIAYCGWGFDEGILHGSYGRFFELLEIDKSRLIDIRKPSRFTEIIIPEQCYLRDKYYTAEYMEMIRKLKGNIHVKGIIPCEKVYFSRSSFISKTGWYREYNERIIEDTFKKNGYMVLDPSSLNLDEQIYYMDHCDSLAAINSSTGADSVFMNPDTERVWIKKGYYMDADLSQLDQMTEARRVTVIDCWLHPYKGYKKSQPTGPNLIGMTCAFRRYLKDKNMQTLNKGYYRAENAKVYLWYLAATARNIVFAILYPIYFHTLRKLIKR